MAPGGGIGSVIDWGTFKFMVATVGIEPTTYRLSSDCST